MDAFDFGNDCIQYIPRENITLGSEDCLYLNVYVPTNTTSIDVNAKLPVIILLYGGRFIGGSARDYGLDFLIEENVIVVRIQNIMTKFTFLNSFFQ